MEGAALSVSTIEGAALGYTLGPGALIDDRRGGVGSWTAGGAVLCYALGPGVLMDGRRGGVG